MSTHQEADTEHERAKYDGEQRAERYRQTRKGREDSENAEKN